LNLPDRDSAGVGPPIDYEGADKAAIPIVLADSQTIYRVGMQKIFALEKNARGVQQADGLAGLHHAIQRFPTDVILLEGKLIAGTACAVPELVRCAPELKIIVLSSQDEENDAFELYHRGVLGTTQQVIKNHLYRIYGKLGVSDRLELVLFCLQGHHRALLIDPATGRNE
jgi:DNA-binding NarL/FixJ family response regulator